MHMNWLYGVFTVYGETFKRMMYESTSKRLEPIAPKTRTIAVFVTRSAIRKRLSARCVAELEGIKVAAEQRREHSVFGGCLVRCVGAAVAVVMLTALFPLRLVPVATAAVATPTSLALVAVVFLLVLYFYRKAYERPEGFPPGPPRLPIYGSYWLLLWENYGFLHKSLLVMARRYKTNVLGFFLGDYPSVVFTDYEDIKEMQSRPDFAGRPDVIVTRERSFGDRHGVVFNDGPEWTELRRFLLRHMRDYGWGRRFPAAEEIMQQEMADAVALLRGEWSDPEVVRDGRVLISHMFAPYGLNCMWAMFGHARLVRGQHAPWHRIHRSVGLFFRATDPSGSAVSLTPWLRFLTPSRFGLATVHETNQPLRHFVAAAIKEHKETFQEGSEGRDFVDKFLQLMTEVKGDHPVFSESQLLLTGVDMVTASSGALSASVAFLWQQLLHHPEVQAKVQQEIDDVIGRSRFPTLDDRPNMPYSEATIRESMRRVTVAPLSLAHTALEDTTFKGYTIPKGTLLYAHLHAMHMDPRLWGDPENFRPEHFLEADGSLKKKDISFPFGGGKRLCLGETFSRQIMFLFMTHILQSFTLLPTGPLPPIDHAFHGFSLVPDDLWARIVPRS